MGGAGGETVLMLPLLAKGEDTGISRLETKAILCFRQCQLRVVRLGRCQLHARAKLFHFAMQMAQTPTRKLNSVAFPLEQVTVRSRCQEERGLDPPPLFQSKFLCSEGSIFRIFLIKLFL